MTYPSVQLTEAERSFLWGSCSPVADHIPTRCAPPSGFHDEGYDKVTAELPQNNTMVRTPMGASEADLARKHLVPPYTEFLVHALGDIAQSADQVEGESVVRRMANAVAELIDPETGEADPLVFVLGERSYRRYIAEYTEKAFADSAVNFAPVTFVQNPVYCLPRLAHNIVFAEGSLALDCGRATLSRPPERDVRVLDQLVRLSEADGQIIGFD